MESGTKVLKSSLTTCVRKKNHCLCKQKIFNQISFKSISCSHLFRSSLCISFSLFKIFSSFENLQSFELFFMLRLQSLQFVNLRVFYQGRGRIRCQNPNFCSTLDGGSHLELILVSSGFETLVFITIWYDSLSRKSMLRGNLKIC